MLIRVNKATSTRKPVKYAALSSGTISHVWYDEEASSAKRPNRILLKREAKETPNDKFDA